MTSMTPSRLEAMTNRLHACVTVLVLWLIATSPWVSMLRRIPSGAGALTYAHVVLGLIALPCGLAYALLCIRGPRRRLYFPWSAEGLRAVGRDLSGLLRGRVPAAEGGGLFGLIEGLLLLALLLAAVTGAGWLAARGSEVALAWREVHLLAARVLVGLTVAHVLAVSAHLLEFLRES
ncbi:MAG TPA: cytochrome b/b6 domain-containing protein [Steroidobacteraceae bacterium]|nr:cytochrome b/b6 domain-containing protein [Steroidobacteraceae bacterium]